MPDLHETVARHEELWKEQFDINRENNEAIQFLKEGQERIVDMIGEVATKRDYYELRTHIDGAINGLLRDALNATPKDAADRQIQATRAGNTWLAVAAIAAVCGLVATILIGAVTMADHRAPTATTQQQ